MSVKATLERHDRHRVALTVEVDAERVEAALDQAFKKVVKRVSVPGFRKGRVPRPIFERRVGVQVLFDEALDDLLPEAYAAAVRETGIEPVERPAIEIVRMAKNAPLVFKAVVTVRPDVTWPEEAEHLVLEKVIRPVTDADVEVKLRDMREKVAVLEPVDGPVAEGMLATVDYEGFIDGERIAAGTDVEIEVGAGRTLPDFEQGLIGLPVGETRTVDVRFPDDYREADLAGKTATFTVTVKTLKQKRYPELDDDFAREVSDFDSLDELKASLRRELEAEREKEATERLRDQAAEAFAARVNVDLPDVMIREEAHDMVHELEHALLATGIPLQAYLRMTNKTEDDLITEFWETAKKRVTIRLALEAYARKHDLEPTPEEREAEVRKIAEAWRVSPEEAVRALEGRGTMAVIERSLRVRKAIDRLLADADVTVREATDAGGEADGAEGKRIAAGEEAAGVGSVPPEGAADAKDAPAEGAEAEGGPRTSGGLGGAGVNGAENA
ncbi:MAG: trigger factor [Hydrogenibacillus schlegelii]|nr:trigger factor [Hydrogenibacillus schlegelii]